MGRGARGCGVGLRAVAARGARSAQMWERDEGMSIGAEVSGRVALRALPGKPAGGGLGLLEVTKSQGLAALQGFVHSLP